MRIERTGAIDPLTPRVFQFIIRALGGRSLDEIEAQENLRIDYICLNGLLAVEIKSLKEDASGRMDNLINKFRERDDWPIFLGSAPMESFFKNMKDPDAIRRKALDRLGRAIITDLRKANQQLGAHSQAFPRKNSVRLMLLINEDHEIYSPEVVSHILWRALHREDAGRPLYPNIDCVIYMSERHASIVDRRVSFPIVTIEGRAFSTDVWKRSAVDRFARGWADWNASPIYEAEDAQHFSTIDHIPHVASRQKEWEIGYRRNPYMRALTDEQLRERFDDSIVISLLNLMKNSPVKLAKEATMLNSELFTHLMMELAERGIPITAMPYSPERHLAAASRLRLPLPVVEWLKSLQASRPSSNIVE